MIPELQGAAGAIRIPELRNVVLTSRVASIVDHPAFQRLRRVRQLGPTHLVYPGAVHSRFEHSLGVYDMARRYVQALLRYPHVAESLTAADLESAMLAGLLHDLGHYPFAHSLEAVHLQDRDTPRHEDLVGQIVRGEIPSLRGEQTIGELIDAHFSVSADEVIALVAQKRHTHARPERRLMASIISSGVDADKADYLERDSVHMGVSYGRNYDRARFLDSLCPNLTDDCVAVTEKGKVASEIFVFSRYTMFSEAYWHHTVRSASAMVEHALTDFQLREEPELQALTTLLLERSDDAFLEYLVRTSPAESPTHALLSAMIRGQRSLYKRVLTLSRVWDDQEIQTAYDRIYLLDREQLLSLGQRLRELLSRYIGRELLPHELIIDTPPRDKDRIETVDVVFNRAHQVAYRLDEVSRVVQGIGTDFVKVVKKIRLFVPPCVRDKLRASGKADEARRALIETILAFKPDLQQQLIL